MDCPHLDNHALLRVLYSAAGAEETAHAASCDACAGAISTLRSRRPAEPPELPEAFWRRQADTILAAAEPAPALHWVFAGSAAVALLAAALVSGAPPPRPLYTAADDKLLREVHSMVSRIEPRALAPAALLLPPQPLEEQFP